jgi:hypothetical protein
MEIWKDIKGYEGLYQVSNFGNVKSLERLVRYEHSKTRQEFYKKNKEIIKKKSYCKGYCSVSLCKENKSSTKRICRLVAIAFIPNPKNKSQVNHIDVNKRNDNVENLEWNTPAENIRHAFENNLMNVKRGVESKKSKKVKCLITDKIFGNIKEFSKYKNIDPSNISRALSGRYKNNHNVEYYNL